jgi:crotonobetainyl-CoA:carnitine CoA-transferase CaiB-like acyl-CoA transferase
VIEPARTLLVGSGLAIHLSGAPAGFAARAAASGEDTDQVLRDLLGYRAITIEALHHDGVA